MPPARGCTASPAAPSPTSAAAAVLAVVAGVGWLAQLRGPEPALDPEPAAPAGSLTPSEAPATGALQPTPARPVLLHADGWTLSVDDELGQVAWNGPGDARVLDVTVGGVADPFRYDRYRDVPFRRELGLLGRRALHAEWKADGVRYRVAAVPAGRRTIQVLEATGMTRAAFLAVVGTATWVSPAEYEAAVAAAADRTHH